VQKEQNNFIHALTIFQFSTGFYSLITSYVLMTYTPLILINIVVIMIMIITISGSTVLVRTLVVSQQRFRNLIKTLGRTPLDK
jgi:hypothetical protein